MNSVEINNELKELLSGANSKVQLSVPQLVEKATSRGEAVLTVDGAIVAELVNTQVALLKINIWLKKKVQKAKSTGVK